MAVMDFLQMIDSFRGIACVISRRRSGVGGSSAYVIAAANRNYLASVRKQDEPFVANRPYTDYISYDPNFEALVDSCIESGKISHQYVNAALYDAWLDIYMIPLEEDQDGNGFCLFTYEMNRESDSDKMMGISAETAYMVLKTCIKFNENYDFTDTMDSVVRDIRNQCESDGCAILLTDKKNRKIDYLFFDHASDVSFAPEDEDIFFKPEFYEIVEGWRDIMGGTNCFIIPDQNALKEVEKKDARWYHSLVQSGVKSLVLYPLRVHDELYGYIFATNFNADKTNFIREVMELNSFVLSAETENFRMRQQLEMMSTTDILTGVLNRNAMNRRVKELEESTADVTHGLGAVFVDLNGLKTANDSLGHNEGDEMLKKVAAKVRAVFEAKEIYRAGGDEFLVITTDLKRDDFNKRFEQLKSVSRLAGEPSFALGAHYEESDLNVRKIMHIADQNMYKDKADYYESNPELNRRFI